MTSNLRFLLPLLLAATAFAAPTIPADSIAKKGELLFADDFSGTPDKRWVRVVDTFKVADGALLGTQTRVKNEPTKDGKGVITAHAAVYGLEVPNKDSVVEVRIKLDGASMVDVELDDRNYTGCHYGHICRAQVRYDAKTKKGSVVIIDEKDGGMKNETRAMLQDPARKAEAQKLLVGRSATFPADVKPGEWQTLVVEIVDDQIRVVLDGKPVGYLKSSGIAHATKTRYEFGVAGAAPGHTGQFDDLKIYSASAK
jgi:hypothetical protein